MRIGAAYLLLLLLACASARAGHLDFSGEELLQIAQNWQKQHTNIFNQEVLKLKSVQQVKQDGEIFSWIVYPQCGGYLAISASDLTSPVIAASQMPVRSQFLQNDPLIRLLKYDLSNRIYRATLDTAEQVQHALEWQTVLSSQAQRTARLDTIIFNETPQWGQGWAAGNMVFNLYTPNNWSTGCVATALAEVLAFYRWPLQGTGNAAYWDNGNYLSVFFSNYEYNWTNILDNYATQLSTQTQRNAAGLLSYHTAISVFMDFELEGSTANTADGVTALHYHFRSSGHYTTSGTSGFLTQVINNLEDGRPVILALNSAIDHAAVADGYASQYGLIHLNFGWNGDNNGWYDISGAFLPGYDYTILGALKGIVPNPMFDGELYWHSEYNFDIAWLTSPRLNADYFELQQKLGSNAWVSLSTAIPDTNYTVTVSGPGTYSYRVRANRDAIWWDWSREITVSIGNAVTLQFVMDLQDRPLNVGEELVLIGNIPPLGNVQNSPEFSYQGNGIYTANVTFENSYIGDTLLYRYGVVSTTIQEFESENRAYRVDADELQTLDTARFNIYLALDGGSRGVPVPEFRITRLFPNPFNSSLNLEIVTDRSGVYSTEWYDMRGQRRSVSRSVELNMGRNRVQFDVSDYNWSSGVYFLRVGAGPSAQVIKCQYIK